MTAVRPERRRKPRKDDPELRGRREAPRAYVVLPAVTEALSGHGSVKLLDVSETGARLEGSNLPPVGKDIVLKCSAIDTLGRVTWSTADRCGVRFYDPLPVRDLVALRDLALSFERSEMTPEELQAASDWESGLAR